jgi:CheY-like chemotaxis protein
VFLTKPLVRPVQLREALIAGWISRHAPAIVLLPPPSRDPPILRQKTTVPDVRSLRVLVAEDNAVNQLLVKRMFEKIGCQIDLAGNGREAVKMASESPYDIIFMDCSMPELDGYEATAVVRASEVGKRRTPIIALTANAMLEDRERCLTAGMDDHLSKPVSMDDIRRALKRWVVDEQNNDLTSSG